MPRRKADEFYADAPDDSLFTFAAAWPEWPKVTPKGLTTPYAKLIAWLTRNCQGDWCAAKHKRILCVVGRLSALNRKRGSQCSRNRHRPAQ